MSNTLTQSLRTLLLALVLSIGISYAYATWSDPTATPPNINASAPINVSIAPQVKGGGGLGDFGVSGILKAYSNLIVDGSIGVGTSNPGNYSINVEQKGDASLKLVADTDNNYAGDNPLIFMTQDAGANAFLIGMTGDPGTDPLDSLYTGTTRNAMFVGDPGGGGVTGDLQFGTNNAVRMTIDGSIGNVGIGTDNPTEKLEVAGNVKATAFLYSSDERLKKDITTLSGALKKVLNLRGVQFKWNNGDDTENVGFIAQEVEKVIPQVVRTGSDGLKSVEYGNIVPLLVEAMKEQQKEIDSLKTEIEVLKGNR